MNRARGIQLLDEVEGTGRPAAIGDRVVFSLKLFLNRGDEVPLDVLQASQVPAEQRRIVGAEVFIDRVMTLGKRQAIAGLERTLLGMKAGGYRKVRVSPHLAYGPRGVPGLIAAHAVLVIEVWLRQIEVAASGALG